MKAKCSCTCVYSVDNDGYRCYTLEVCLKNNTKKPSFSLIHYSVDRDPKPYAYKSFVELYAFILKYLYWNNLECLNLAGLGFYDILFVNLKTGNACKYQYREDVKDV